MDLQISKNHLSKKELKELAKKRAESLLDDGMITPLEAFVISHRYEVLAKFLKEALLEDAKDEVFGKGVNCLSAKITESQSTRYDYSENPDWVMLKNQINDLQEKMKSAYKSGGLVIDPETGEVIPSAIPIPSKIGLKVLY